MNDMQETADGISTKLTNNSIEDTMKGAADVKGKQARLITWNISGKYIFNDKT